MGRPHGHLAEGGLEVGVALARAGLAAGLHGAGRHLGPRAQALGRAEHAHAQADLADDGPGRVGAAPGEGGDALDSAGAALGDDLARGGVDQGGGGHGGDGAVEQAGHRLDAGAQVVDLVQEHPGQAGVVVGEAPVHRLGQVAQAGPGPALGQPGERLGVALARR